MNQPFPSLRSLQSRNWEERRKDPMRGAWNSLYDATRCLEEVSIDSSTDHLIVEAFLCLLEYCSRTNRDLETLVSRLGPRHWNHLKEGPEGHQE